MRPEGEVFSHLESCLQKIQRQFFPANREGKTPMLLGETLIDQRLFWDCFRHEQDVIVLLYQIDLAQLVFVSSSVKRLLGYSPGDFRIRFHEIVHDSPTWTRHLHQLRWRKRLYAPLAFKEGASRNSSRICAWDGYFAELDRGMQAHYAVVVLYPAYCHLPRPRLLLQEGE